jgi:hypothetical protein
MHVDCPAPLTTRRNADYDMQFYNGLLLDADVG